MKVVPSYSAPLSEQIEIFLYQEPQRPGLPLTRLDLINRELATNTNVFFKVEVPRVDCFGDGVVSGSLHVQSPKTGRMRHILDTAAGRENEE